MNEGLLRKVNLYILSLALLFMFFIIITAKEPDVAVASELTSWCQIIRHYAVTIVSFFLLAYSFFAYKRFDYDLKGTTQIPFEIKKIESINYEHLTFLATYVVPLISFDFDVGRQVIVLFLLLIVMGVIYIKTDLFYANPSLALLGFHIYRADGNFKNGQREGIILISREKLIQDQTVSYIKLDDRIYFVRRVGA